MFRGDFDHFVRSPKTYNMKIEVNQMRTSIICGSIALCKPRVTGLLSGLHDMKNWIVREDTSISGLGLRHQPTHVHSL